MTALTIRPGSARILAIGDSGAGVLMVVVSVDDAGVVAASAAATDVAEDTGECCGVLGLPAVAFRVVCDVATRVVLVAATGSLCAGVRGPAVRFLVCGECIESPCAVDGCAVSVGAGPVVVDESASAARRVVTDVVDLWRRVGLEDTAFRGPRTGFVLN